MSTPFTDPYSETATFHDLVGELALAFYQRRHALLGPDDWIGSLQDNRDIQIWSYWAGLQTMLLNMTGRPNWVKYKSYSTWPPPVYASEEEIYAAAGLPSTGFRRATAWDGVNDPAWQYGKMQAGDIIGPWIIEDLQKYLSVLRWLYWDGTPLHYAYTPPVLTVLTRYDGIGSSGTIENSQIAAESAYKLVNTHIAEVQALRHTYQDFDGTTWVSWLESRKVTVNFSWHAHLLDCPRQIISRAYVEAYGTGTFDGYGDYDAPGYHSLIDYPAHTGASPEIVLGTADKPLPWHGVNGQYGYTAIPQVLIKWDFTNCNEV